MRILVAHQVPRARTAGMSRLMGFIHDRVASAGHEVDYLCSDDVPPSWSGALGRRFKFPMAVRKKAAEAEKEGRPYDIVNVHEPSAVPLVVGRRHLRSAVVVTSHGLEWRAWELAKEEARLGRQGPGWRSRLTYPISSLWPGAVALRRADHVFCLNEEDRAELMQGFGRCASSVTRIHPGADEVYARASRHRRYEGVRRILFAASWRKNKGIEDLVPAFMSVAQHHAAMSLHVVGCGVSSEQVLTHFPSWLHGRICFTSPDDEEGMAAAFAASDLFLLPSLFEGTPLTLIQAMMSGLPIVTTATCGMKDAIADGKTGLLVPVRSPEAIVSAVERLVRDLALCEKLGLAARADALQRFTWDRAADPVLRAYEYLDERRPG